MNFSHFEIIQFSICALAAISLIIGKLSRLPDRRIFLFLLTAFLLTLTALLQFEREHWILASTVISILLIELGVFAYIYDHYRVHRSVSGNLRNMGALYIFIGVVCFLSRLANFPVLFWSIPIILLALGYFFLRRRRGLASLCKGAGVIVSVAFVASMVYDIREGALPTHKPIPLRDRLLPEIVKPSFVDELNKLNERLSLMEKRDKELTEQLLVKNAKSKELQTGLDVAVAGRKEAEQKLKAAEQEKAAVEQKLAEFEKAKSAAKESFSNIEEKLNQAAENLKKAIQERDELKAEVEKLKATSTPMPMPGAESTVALEQEVKSLKQQLQQKEEDRSRLALELDKLSKVLERIREALVTE